jgi:RHH-type transcriptional regulator, rel operon repressor / antitoxin RelB
MKEAIRQAYVVAKLSKLGYVYPRERGCQMSKQTAVRLPDETFARLQALAARTGRTATYYIREAVEEHLDDLEDIYLAEQVIERVRKGEESMSSLDEVERRLGLAD